MFKILNDKTICLTRGDIADIVVAAKLQNGEPYTFKKGDVVRFAVFKKKECSCVVIQKDAVVEAEATSVIISLTADDTRLDEIISKPVDYWYEIVVNPDTAPQTIIGYDEAGEKIFRLFPEGGDAE